MVMSLFKIKVFFEFVFNVLLSLCSSSQIISALYFRNQNPTLNFNNDCMLEPLMIDVCLPVCI